MQSNLEIKVKAMTRILKFAEGQDPEKDEPVAIEEKEIVLTGEEAKKLLEELGGEDNGTN